MVVEVVFSMPRELIEWLLNIIAESTLRVIPTVTKHV